MARTVRASALGFCSGVRRAIRLLDQALKRSASVSTLGPIVHNRAVTESFARRGATIVSSDSDVVSGVLVFRSHGAERRTVERFSAAQQVDIVDGTCPQVARLHGMAERASDAGEQLVVVGDRDHPEVRGIVSRASEAIVISSTAEARSVILPEKCCVIAQTTCGRDRFDSIRRILTDRYPGIEVTDTLCREVEARRLALRDLAPCVDAILVVGDRSSSNCRRLFVEARKTGLPSWLVEGPEELPDEIERFVTVGITAGASTPPEVIDAVESAVRGVENRSR